MAGGYEGNPVRREAGETHQARRGAGSLTQLERLFVALIDGNVDFIIVGGVAARAHGSARLTDDLDITYSRSPPNLARVVKALAPLKPYLRGAPPGLPFEWSVATLRAGLNFTLTTSSGSIDLLGEITGGGRYENLLSHSLKIEIFDREALLLDLPWLIQVKRAAGSPKDLEIIAELEALVEEGQRSP